jgi:hypothetical protein
MLTFSAQGQDIWMTPNRGQWDHRIDYSVDLNQGKLYLEKNGMTFYFTDALSHNHSEHEDHSADKKGTSFHVIKQEFIAANSNCSKIEKNSSPNYKNYILGSDPSKWKSNVYSFAEVTYSQFYSGIDLFYKSEKDQLSYNFVVFPNGNAQQIKFQLPGAENIKVDVDGNLRIKHRFGEIIQSAPVAWELNAEGKKTEVACSFQVTTTIKR